MKNNVTNRNFDIFFTTKDPNSFCNFESKSEKNWISKKTKSFEQKIIIIQNYIPHNILLLLKYFRLDFVKNNKILFENLELKISSFFDFLKSSYFCKKNNKKITQPFSTKCIKIWLKAVLENLLFLLKGFKKKSQIIKFYLFQALLIYFKKTLQKNKVYNFLSNLNYFRKKMQPKKYQSFQDLLRNFSIIVKNVIFLNLQFLLKISIVFLTAKIIFFSKNILQKRKTVYHFFTKISHINSQFSLILFINGIDNFTSHFSFLSCKSRHILTNYLEVLV